MDNNGKPKDWKSVIAPETLADIQDKLDKILVRQQEAQQEIDELTQAGCIFGNVVTEWRGRYGPYYRLHYYVNPKTGEKAKPRYIKANEVENIEQQIANYKKRAALMKRVEEIDKALSTAKQHADMLRGFLERKEQFTRYEQANLL